MDPNMQNPTNPPAGGPAGEPPFGQESMPTGDEGKKKANLLMWGVIALVVIVILFLWFFFMRQPAPAPTPAPVVTPPTAPPPAPTDETGAPVVDLETDTTTDIQQDLDATNLGDIEGEFMDIDKELEQL